MCVVNLLNARRQVQVDLPWSPTRAKSIPAAVWLPGNHKMRNHGHNPQLGRKGSWTGGLDGREGSIESIRMYLLSRLNPRCHISGAKLVTGQLRHTRCIYLTRPYPEYTATAPAMGSCPAGRDIRKVPTSPKDKYVPPMRKLANYMLSLVSQATRSLPATALGKKPFI